MIEYRKIRTSTDVDLVVAVISRMYILAGYIEPDKEVDLVTHTYIGRDDAVTVVAADKECTTALGTISVITDRRETLPMDVVYEDKLSVFREQGLRLAEVRRFAVDSEAIAACNSLVGAKVEETEVSVRLLGIAIKYALKQQCDLVCFMIKKEHRPFYEALTCIQVGEERPCPAINNKPVVGHVLDLRELRGKELDELPKNFLLRKVLSTEVDDTFFD